MKNAAPLMIKKHAGFSIIEVISVIVVLGIMSVGIVSYISSSALAYSKAAARNQVTSAGRIVVELISMDLHNALPQSTRVSTSLTSTDESNDYGYEHDQCIEFMPTKAATTYLNPRFRPRPASVNPFNVVKLIPDQVGETGRYAVIYPTKSTNLYKDSFGNTESLVEVTIASGGTGTDILTPTSAHRFKRRSPQNRLYISTEPVSYCTVNNKLFRYSDYGFHSTQLIPKGPGGTCIAASCLPDTTPERELITDQIDNDGLTTDVFDFLSANRRRNGVVQIELNFSLNGESILLNHEVLQQATP